MARRYVTRDGKRLNVDESEVLPGEVVETEAESRPILAAANKGLSSLTFGLTDVGHDADQRKNIQDLRTQNPTASTVGEVGGEIVQSLLVPEVKAAKLVGNLAIQGGLSGLGSQISEAALNNRPINTELLAADVLSRAGTGALVGAGFTGVSKLASKVAGKAGELAASEKVISAAGNIRKGVLKKTLGIDDELFKYGDDAGLFASTSHEGVAAMATEAERKAGYKLTEAFDKAVEVIPDYAPLRDRWVELSIETGPAARKGMREIEKTFEQGLKDVGGAAAGRATKVSSGGYKPHEDVMVPLSELDDIGAVAWDPKRVPSIAKGFKEGADFPAIQVSSSPTGNRVVDDGLHRLDIARRRGVKEIKVRFGDREAAASSERDVFAGEHVLAGPARDKWAAALKESPELAPYAPGGRPRGGVSEPFQEIPKRRGPSGSETRSGRAPSAPAESAPRFGSDEFFNAKAIKEAAINANKSFDLGGAIQNAAVPAIFGGPKAAAALVGKDLIQHAANQKGGYLAAKALEKIQTGKVLPNVFKGFQARVEGMLATAPGLLGPFATVLGHAAQEGAESLMAAHSALVQGPQGAEYLARMGMRPESPEETKAYGAKLAMLEALEAQKQEFDISVDKATRSFFKGDSFEGAPRDTSLSTKDFERKLKSLEQAIRDPSSLAARVPTDVMAGAPGLTAEAGQQAMMAAQFLVERAPKPTDLWKPESLRTPFNPGKTELQKWNRYADAVENPRVAAVEIARGKATPEALETVKTLYPNLFAEVQQKVMNQLMMLKKPLPYAKRQSLANTFGPQLLGVSPEAQLYLQSVHMAARPPPEAQPGPSQDGRQMVNSNKNLQTQTDRIANR